MTISIQLTMPKASQVRRAQRQVAPLPEVKLPETRDGILTDALPPNFRVSFREGDATAAFQIRSRRAEQLFFQVAKIQSHDGVPANIHRGDVKFHDTRKYPKISHGRKQPSKIAGYGKRYAELLKAKKQLRDTVEIRRGLVCSA